MRNWVSEIIKKNRQTNHNSSIHFSEFLIIFICDKFVYIEIYGNILYRSATYVIYNGQYMKQSYDNCEQLDVRERKTKAYVYDNVYVYVCPCRRICVCMRERSLQNLEIAIQENQRGIWRKKFVFSEKKQNNRGKVYNNLKNKIFIIMTHFKIKS